jgi:glutaredoxin
MAGMGPRRRSLLALAAVVVAAGSATAAWRLGAPHDLGKEVAAHAKPGDIFMYSATTCGYCKKLARWFWWHDVPYASCEIDLDKQCRAGFYANKGVGTPLMIVRGTKLHGYQPARIAELLRPAPVATAPQAAAAAR